MARGDRIALAGMLSLLLGACSLAPTYKLQPVQTTADFQGVGPWRQAAPADALPRGAWWEVFGNPELNDLEQRVGKSNATLAAALAHFDATRYDVWFSPSNTKPSPASVFSE